MRILITGVQGTLGSVLQKELRLRGHDVYGCDLHHSKDEQTFRADVAEPRQLDAVFQESKPELVYHLAAEFGRMNGEEYYEQLWRTNCIGTRNIIEACLSYGSRLAFASSSEAYGDADRYAKNSSRFSEEWLDFYAPGFHNEYALTKWANERQIFLAAKNRKLNAVVLRFFNAYGPGEYYTPYRSVVCLFAYRLMKGLPITVYRNYSRVFMWVGDWARTVANLANTNKFDYLTDANSAVNHEGRTWPGSLDSGVPVFNIGGEEYATVEHLKDMLVEILGGSKSEISYLDAEKANVISKQPDNRRASAFLQHKPTVTLAEGLPLTVDWMRRVYA